MSSGGRSEGNTGPIGPLAGLRVLELADEKGQFCGKLMADLGADVIKVEPPGGQDTRSIGPFLDDIPHPERSISFWHYNTSKRGITLNLETNDGRELFRRLAATTDIILESYPPGYLSSLGLGYEDLAASNPRLIMCSLTPFGQEGPWRDYRSSDLLHLAAGGEMASCGYDEEDDPEETPIAAGAGQAWNISGHYAYMGILCAVLARDMTGEGQYIDASIHEACALTTEGAITTYIYTGNVMVRHTGRHATGEKFEPRRRSGEEMMAQDGSWVHTALGDPLETPRGLASLAEWMNEHGKAQDLLDEKYQDPAVIMESRPHIYEVMSDFFRSMDPAELWHGGQARGWPWGAVRSVDELIDDPQLASRGFYIEVEHPELGRALTYPGPGPIYNGSPWGISRRAPLIGEHNVEVLCGELGLSKMELAVLAESRIV